MDYYVNKEELQYLIFDGISSADFGIIITNTNQLSGPERNLEMIEVDGRDEALVVDKGNYKPFELKLECSIDSENIDINELARNIKRWLQSDFSYKKLILSDDDEYYYEAICANKLDIEEVITELGEFQVTFLCKPLRKYINGDNKITIITPKTIQNNYMKSKPHIKIIANGDVTININNQKLILKALEDEIIIDCELMNAYKIDKFTNEVINKNNKMYSDFPTLEEGKNKIIWTGEVDKIEITPRWVVL